LQTQKSELLECYRFEIVDQWFLTGGNAFPGERQNFPRGRKNVRAVLT